MAVSLAPQDFQLPFTASPMDPQQHNQTGTRASPAVVPTSGTPPRLDPPARSATPLQNDSNVSNVNVPFVPYPMSPQQWPNPPQAALSPHGPFPYPTFGYFAQQPGMQSPFPAYDPSQQSQQFAQWAYQQMMIAQQQQMAAAGFIPRQRTGSAPQHPSDQAQAGFYHGMASPMMANGFQSPSFGHNHTNSTSSSKGTSTEPYRRNNASSAPSPVAGAIVAGLPQAAFPPLQAAQPPYARERNGSVTSVNSSGGSSRSVNNTDGRRRTTSMAESAKSSSTHRPTNSSTSNSQSSSASRSRSPTPRAIQTRSASPEPSKSLPSVHQRGSSPNPSSSTPRTRTQSTTSSASNTASSPSTTQSPSAPAPAPNGSSSARGPRGPPKPSPLSQQATVSDANKRLSRDDTDLAVTLPDAPSHIAKSGGLKGRLRRALSFSAGESLSEAEHEPSTPRLGSRRQVVAAKNAAEQKEAEKKLKSSSLGSKTASTTQSPVNSQTHPVVDEEELEAPDPSLRSGKKKGRSLFNRKFNASTDNISLSSTVSSASLMIRKIGSVGALARRKSLAGITSLFKDKKDKSKKGGTAEPDVSLVNAELDRDLPALSPDEMAGLSPAAKLARQHTLRSNAEAAARARANQEAKMNQPAASGSVPTWERDTAKREANSPLRVRGQADENGRRLSSHSRSYSEDGSEDGSLLGHVQQRFTIEENDFLDEDDEDLDDGDVTVRHESIEIEVEPWAVGIRRSIERTRVPSKGILKNAVSYNQENDLMLSRSHSLSRHRSNSYDTVSHHHHVEPGPLARIPSADPDHIDGLPSHEPHSLFPPLKFGDIPSFTDSPTSTASSSPTHEKSGMINISHHPNMPYAHPNMNSSAPTLSLMHSEMTPRSKTAPTVTKKTTFAANLSVYDTFSAFTYDRHSEPATCNQLTPALAQRIKEELNAYKMEEMEVHHASRAHTQFFV
ncbi:uncharacterized protein EI90DRAFT_1184068 [Cantharellus anzutake]|uniref:uncharacterized protein n=1 Tax=Cantharellus anzutake TaxID=1750568 RepID=UPI0019056973|nr:uncharacterized protein EI90DRAFT_1184068 [Cantharellus anzutake]KAF8330354.1 hypothetical protein EI90DRAFT_1184068 [Cantharellus anzutake]